MSVYSLYLCTCVCMWVYVCMFVCQLQQELERLCRINLNQNGHSLIPQTGSSRQSRRSSASGFGYGDSGGSKYLITLNAKSELQLQVTNIPDHRTGIMPLILQQQSTDRSAHTSTCTHTQKRSSQATPFINCARSYNGNWQNVLVVAVKLRREAAILRTLVRTA